MDIHIYKNAERVAQEAAKRIAEMARQDIAGRGRFVMAVSGGKTPWQMLRALGQENIPWKNIHILQVDERVAPAGDPDRNLTYLCESLLEFAPINPEQIYAMPVEENDLDAAAKEYIRTIQEIAGTPPVLDLIHLGMGADGHTASLVPGDQVLKIMDTDVSLTGPYLGRRRMTLTYPVINRARRVLWMITGGGKFEMFKRFIGGDESIPAGRINKSHAIVIADEEASGRLEPTTLVREK
jgi:6-phosphogluconolactonase